MIMDKPVPPARQALSSGELVAALEKKVLGEGFPEGFDELKKEADMVVREVQANNQGWGQKDLNLARALELRGHLFRRMGWHEEARVDYVESLGLMSGCENADEGIGRVCTGMAVVHDKEGKVDSAMALYARAIRSFERLEPPAYADIADLSNTLAYHYQERGEFEKAEELFLGALDGMKLAYGENVQEVATLYNNLGNLYLRLEDVELAREALEKALKVQVKLYGKGHAETAQTQANLALVYLQEENVDEAKEWFENALKGFESDLWGFGHDYRIVVDNYRDVLWSLNDSEGVAALNARAVDRLRSIEHN